MKGSPETTNILKKLGNEHTTQAKIWQFSHAWYNELHSTSKETLGKTKFK